MKLLLPLLLVMQFGCAQMGGCKSCCCPEKAKCGKADRSCKSEKKKKKHKHHHHGHKHEQHNDEAATGNQ